MLSRIGVGDAAAEVDRTGLPTLFVDTCAAFDVSRCAARNRPRFASIVAVLLDAWRNGDILLYAPSVLEKEAARNRVKAEGEARAKAGDVDQAIATYRRVAGHMGTAYPSVATFSHVSLVPPLVSLHDRLLAACTHLVTDPALTLTAFARASDNRRPARKGGGANDCLLLEEFRAVAKAVPTASPLVLLTTNPEDFGDEAMPGRGHVHPETTDDLAGTLGRVCLSWDAAAAAVLTGARLATI